MDEENYTMNRMSKNYHVTLENDDALAAIRKSENFNHRCGVPGFDALEFQNTGSVMLIEKFSNGKYNFKIPGDNAEEIKKELSSLLPNRHFL